MSPDADVIVVGGGPAGASTAYHLARRGRHVLLLDRQRFPRDKSCGDGLTRRAVRALDRMGALDDLAGAFAVRGVATHVRGRGVEHLPYPTGQTGLVLPRLHLDAALLARARAAGAEVRGGAVVTELLRDAAGVRGVVVRPDGAAGGPLTAPVTVLAAGAASRLGDGPEPREGRGFAVRTYLTGLDAVPDELEVYLPITDVTDRFLLPSYGWLFPVNPTTANLGIGLFTTEDRPNLRQLAERFLAERRAADPRLTGAKAGPWFGAPVRCDFAPDRCAVPGLVRVGDAAGLVSPFTGEGIGFAVESGELAADLLHRNLDRHGPGPLDLADYRFLMEREHAGYFEAGRRSAQRYRTVWHVLENTFDRQEPLFVAARRAVLYPEALGTSAVDHLLDDVTPLITPGLPVHGALIAVGEQVYRLLRREWPFLARAWLVAPDPGRTPLRPGLLTVLTSRFRLGTGTPREDSDQGQLARYGAAVELGALAMLCHASVVPGDRDHASDGDKPADWGELAAVSLGDFLLTQALALAGHDDPAVARRIATAVADASRGQLLELTSRDSLDTGASRRLAALAAGADATSGLACELGALAGGLDPEAVRHARAYGRALGVTYQLSDELRWYQSGTSGPTTSMAIDPARGVLGVALPWTAEDPVRRRLLRHALAKVPPDVSRAADLVRDGPALDRLETLTGHTVGTALSVLEHLPPGPARQSLAALARWANGRESLPRRDLRTALNLDSHPKPPTH